jgi:diaminohydroxyphosphoribosylaminopyrimidine deaminase/5-amino-6-(5-phosphoribosylamino)uracil reductase
MNDSTIYMRRCLELAEIASGFVAPNPMVGAVLVYDDRIIGEGYHQRFGEAHAEVNAINDAVQNGFAEKISQSTLYVSLEPCNHHGKTPPCSELIIRHRIPKVVIGCKDPFPDVNGTGINTLLKAGVDITTGILENECRNLNRRFMTYHEKKRPFILLKFAQTADGFLAPLTGDGKISNENTDVLVHKWRSEEQAILVGKKTAMKDNPHLTVRKWRGNNPVRVVIDKQLEIPDTHNIYDKESQTIILNQKKNEFEGNIEFVTTKFLDLPSEICNILFDRKVLSVMIEGGANILNQFIDKNLWDEARIIVSKKTFGNGLKAPEIPGDVIDSIKVETDKIIIKQNS